MKRVGARANDLSKSDRESDRLTDNAFGQLMFYTGVYRGYNTDSVKFLMDTDDSGDISLKSEARQLLTALVNYDTLVEWG
jgi:hypothetical protein